MVKANGLRLFFLTFFDLDNNGRGGVDNGNGNVSYHSPEYIAEIIQY